ncbi:MAG: hypothetical protein ACRENP_00120 [Longimicrobiales bacterium]
MKPRKTLLTLLAVTLLSYPIAAFAQRPGTTAYDRARAFLTGTHRAAFTDIVANARSRGLPTQPLVDKVLEGRAKRAAPDKIIVVVREKLDKLARAQTITRSRSSLEIITVADALQRGVDEATIRRVRAEARSREPVGLAIHTLADLLDTGVPRDVALGMIAGWRSRGAAASELRELPAAVERLVRQGATAPLAGGAVASALRSGRAASSVRMAMELRGPSPAGAAGIGGRGAAASAARPPASGRATQSAVKPSGRGN